MDAAGLIVAFHAAVARHLAIYMAVLASACAAAWLGAALSRGRWALAAALTLTLAGGALGAAAHLYRQDIPAKLAADMGALRDSPAQAAADFAARHGAERTWPAFLRLTLLWGGIAAAAMAAMIALSLPFVRGIGAALIFLCAVTWLLDLAAYRRDVAYAAAWKEQPR